MLSIIVPTGISVIIASSIGFSWAGYRNLKIKAQFEPITFWSCFLFLYVLSALIMWTGAWELLLTFQSLSHLSGEEFCKISAISSLILNFLIIYVAMRYTAWRMARRIATRHSRT